MQTFLPHPDFAQSMAALDWRRLQNQVYRECKTLINGGWPNHPASKMWRENRASLCVYALAGIDEMARRNRQAGERGMTPRWNRASLDAHREWLMEQHQLAAYEQGHTRPPAWLGHPGLHASHRSQLLAKDTGYYSRHNWLEEPGALPYVWPTDA